MPCRFIYRLICILVMGRFFVIVTIWANVIVTRLTANHSLRVFATKVTYNSFIFTILNFINWMTTRIFLRFITFSRAGKTNIKITHFACTMQSGPFFFFTELAFDPSRFIFQLMLEGTFDFVFIFAIKAHVIVTWFTNPKFALLLNSTTIANDFFV